LFHQSIEINFTVGGC